MGIARRGELDIISLFFLLIIARGRALPVAAIISAVMGLRRA